MFLLKHATLQPPFCCLQGSRPYYDTHRQGVRASERRAHSGCTQSKARCVQADINIVRWFSSAMITIAMTWETASQAVTLEHSHTSHMESRRTSCVAFMRCSRRAALVSLRAPQAIKSPDLLSCSCPNSTPQLRVHWCAQALVRRSASSAARCSGWRTAKQQRRQRQHGRVIASPQVRLRAYAARWLASPSFASLIPL